MSCRDCDDLRAQLAVAERLAKQNWALLGVMESERDGLRESFKAAAAPRCDMHDVTLYAALARVKELEARAEKAEALIQAASTRQSEQLGEIDDLRAKLAEAEAMIEEDDRDFQASLIRLVDRRDAAMARVAALEAELDDLRAKLAAAEAESVRWNDAAYARMLKAEAMESQRDAALARAERAEQLINLDCPTPDGCIGLQKAQARVAELEGALLEIERDQMDEYQWITDIVVKMLGEERVRQVKGK